MPSTPHEPGPRIPVRAVRRTRAGRYCTGGRRSAPCAAARCRLCSAPPLRRKMEAAPRPSPAPPGCSTARRLAEALGHAPRDLGRRMGGAGGRAAGRGEQVWLRHSEQLRWGRASSSSRERGVQRLSVTCRLHLLLNLQKVRRT